VTIRGVTAFGSGLAFALWAGWVAFPRALYRSAAQPFQFSHKVHTGEKVGLTCDDCHSFGDDGRFAGIPRLDKCSACHSEPVSQSPDEKVFVEKYVKASREVPWLVYSRQPDNVFFSHATHVRIAKLACDKCHGGHGKSDKLRLYQENRISGYSRDIWGPSILRIGASAGGRAGMKMDDCTHCHRENGVLTGCLDCHK
jgi:menaquinone reductase, multiheme cytochrome c subunit